MSRLNGVNVQVSFKTIMCEGSGGGERVGEILGGVEESDA